MGNCISKDQAKDAEEVITTVAGLAGDQLKLPTSEQKPTPTPERTNLLSQQSNKEFKDEVVDPQRTAAMLQMGITIIDLFEKTAKATEMVLPSPLGDVLEKVTGVLKVLKQMAENRTAWRDLLDTVDKHQEIFNGQLSRLKVENMVPDPDSPLLGPVIDYSNSLEKLAAKIMTEGGLLNKDAKESPMWDKIKTFTFRAIHADDEKATMDGYLKQLSKAMDQFTFTLQIFVGFTTANIQATTDALSTDVKAVRKGMDQLQEMVVVNEQPVDHTNDLNVGPLGSQHKKCLEGTRVDVLEEIRVWAGAKDNTKPVYCIGDVAGTGKSTVSLTMYDEWVAQGPTPLAFFFSQQGVSVNTATDFCLYMKETIKSLFEGPELEAHWKKVESSITILKSQSVEQQWKKLVYEPLCMIPKSEVRVMIIDALDECTFATRSDLLKLILTACASGSLPHIRFFITTRNEVDILKVLRNEAYSNFVIHKALRNTANAKTDVEFYVDHRLDEAGIFVSAPEERRLLVDRCDGLFIFAKLACQLLEDCNGGEKPLKDILKEFTELDTLYFKTLANADKKPQYTRQVLKDILGVIVAAHEPLSMTAIAALLPTSTKVTDVDSVVSKLGSILGSAGANDPVYILHATFTEYLLRQSWVPKAQASNVYAITNVYAISKAVSNRNMARSCLSLLVNELKPNSEGEPSAALNYAALVWIYHVIPELHIKDICDLIRRFFREKLLSWIELGARTSTLPEYMLAIGRLQSSMEDVGKSPIQTITDDDIRWCHDILKFLRSNNTILQASPEGVYSSAMMFTSSDSLVYQNYEPALRDSLPTIILGLPTQGPGSTVLTGHDGGVIGIQRIIYSPEGDLIASAASNYEAREAMVWDTNTGATLVHYTSPDTLSSCFGAQFLSGKKEVAFVWSAYGAVAPWHLWKLSYETDELSSPPLLLEGEGQLQSVVWSTDQTYILCGTLEGKILQLSTETGKAVGESIAAHEGKINTIALSPDGTVLVSTSADKRFKIWTVTPQKLTELFTRDYPREDYGGYSYETYGAMFNPADPSLIAVATGDLVVIYNVKTGSFSSGCPGPFALGGILYSPDGKYIAAKGWGQQYADLIIQKDDKTLERTKLETGHREPITAFAFSPDRKYMATGANDQTIRIHDLADVGRTSEVKGHQAEIYALSFSPDHKRCASWDSGGLLCIWNLETGDLVGEPMATEQTTSFRNNIQYTSDGQDVISGNDTSNLMRINFETKKMEQIPFPIKLPFADETSLEVHKMATAPDDTSLAIIGYGFFEDMGPKEVLCIRRTDAPQDAPATVIMWGDPTPARLAYHPSGDYICYGEKVWEIATQPPTEVAGDKTKTILEETFPVFLGCSDESTHHFIVTVGPSIFTTISFRSPVRRTFRVPPELFACAFAAHDGLLAVGSRDGRVTVIDFTRLLKPEETNLLSRIREMRKTSAQRIASS